MPCWLTSRTARAHSGCGMRRAPCRRSRQAWNRWRPCARSFGNSPRWRVRIVVLPNEDQHSSKSTGMIHAGLPEGHNHWEALQRYLEQGYLSIDNNLSERTLRAIALGRNNWGVIGSETGGRTAAVLYTLVGTCKHLGIDPFTYLREALPGLFALGEERSAEQLAEWLPDRWQQRRCRESRAGPAAAG